MIEYITFTDAWVPGHAFNTCTLKPSCSHTENRILINPHHIEAEVIQNKEKCPVCEKEIGEGFKIIRMVSGNSYKVKNEI